MPQTRISAPTPSRTRMPPESGIAHPERTEADALPAAIQALVQATQALTATAAQMAELMQTPAGPGATIGSPAARAGHQVNAWEDDPFSEATASANPVLASPVTIAMPHAPPRALRFAVVEPGPAAGLFAVGTPEFRYWNTASAIARAIAFWSPLLPHGTRWSAQNPILQVRLVAGHDLNAFYSRRDGLRFFEDRVGNLEIFSGESPDVACHELGHAILDALRPQLFDAASLEIAAFHEAFGDISSMLTALQTPAFRNHVLEETRGRLNVNSRLSRLAEQLGWAIRQRFPTAVDRDSLRNAANRFFYHAPEDLPPTAPAAQLSSEPHSFARVFTGGMLDVIAYMVQLVGTPTEATLLGVSGDVGQLLIDAIRTASITPAYYSQVAAAMVQADRVRNKGKYRDALAQAFVRRGILAAAAASDLAKAPLPHLHPAAAAAAARSGTRPNSFDALSVAGDSEMLLTYNGASDDSHLRGYEDAPELPSRPITAEFLGGETVHLHIAGERRRLPVASAALSEGAVEPPQGERAGHAFLEDLVQLGRVDRSRTSDAKPAFSASLGLKTHVLEEGPDGLVLKRLCFDCGVAH
jgi:hypothetical protein